MFLITWFIIENSLLKLIVLYNFFFKFVRKITRIFFLLFFKEFKFTCNFFVSNYFIQNYKIRKYFLQNWL